MTYFNVILAQKLFFETYTRYDLYFKEIPDSSSIQRKFCFKCTLDMTYSSNQISKKSFFWPLLLALKKNPTKFRYKKHHPR